MKRLNASRVGFIGAVLLACTGCNADSPVTTAHSYLKPGDWLSECAGRWILDVPSPIDFGAAAAYDEERFLFRSYASRSMRASGYGSGKFSISGVHFLESNPFSNPSEIRAKKSSPANPATTPPRLRVKTTVAARSPKLITPNKTRGSSPHRLQKTKPSPISPPPFSSQAR